MLVFFWVCPRLSLLISLSRSCTSPSFAINMLKMPSSQCLWDPPLSRGLHFGLKPKFPGALNAPPPWGSVSFLFPLFWYNCSQPCDTIYCNVKDHGLESADLGLHPSFSAYSMGKPDLSLPCLSIVICEVGTVSVPTL